MNECETLELVLAICLVISEALPFLSKNDSCNGIINTIFCLIKKNECKKPDIENAVAVYPPDITRHRSTSL